MAFSIEIMQNYIIVVFLPGWWANFFDGFFRRCHNQTGFQLTLWRHRHPLCTRCISIWYQTGSNRWNAWRWQKIQSAWCKWTPATNRCCIRRQIIAWRTDRHYWWQRQQRWIWCMNTSIQWHDDFLQILLHSNIVRSTILTKITI